MKKLLFTALAAIMVGGCSSNSPKVASNEVASGARAPSSEDLSGDYLGEGLFAKRKTGLKMPAMRLYLEQAPGENGSYYGVLVEYQRVINIAPQYAMSAKVPSLNKIFGYLNSITTYIAAYKVVPTQSGVYEFRSVEVQNGKLVPSQKVSLAMKLDPANHNKNPLAGAKIVGHPDGTINFPNDDEKETFYQNIKDRLKNRIAVRQYELVKLTYKLGHLASTWRGNYNELEGSYLSEYGLLNDGVLELASQGEQKTAQFIKSNTTKAKDYTNPKSAPLQGDYLVTEPVPKMYVLVPPKGVKTASDREMSGRIGLFLDVFDASAPEAGSQMVTELAFTNPNDPKDFMMYYEHPKHLKKIGVVQKK